MFAAVGTFVSAVVIGVLIYVRNPGRSRCCTAHAMRGGVRDFGGGDIAPIWLTTVAPLASQMVGQIGWAFDLTLRATPAPMRPNSPAHLWLALPAIACGLVTLTLMLTLMLTLTLASPGSRVLCLWLPDIRNRPRHRPRNLSGPPAQSPRCSPPATARAPV